LSQSALSESQSALSELFDAFRTGDGVDMIRESVRTVLQELVEFEAAGVIGADRYERTEDRVTERNSARPKLLATCWRPRPATSSCGSPSSARARSSRPSSSPVVASIRPCMRW